MEKKGEGAGEVIDGRGTGRGSGTVESGQEDRPSVPCDAVAESKPLFDEALVPYGSDSCGANAGMCESDDFVFLWVHGLQRREEEEQPGTPVADLDVGV